MTRQQILKHVDQRQPSANDLLRGWHDAEMGVDYQRDETDDWRTGWTLWHTSTAARSARLLGTEL